MRLATSNMAAYLGINIGLREVSKHLVGTELALMLPVLGHLEYADFAALALGELDLLVPGKLLAQVMHHGRLGEQE